MGDDDEFASASEGEVDSPTTPKLTPAPSKTVAGEVSSIPQHPPVNPKQVKEKPKVQPTAGGWGGWGSFFTEAMTAVQESLQADVEGIMTTAKEVGDAVYGTLDPEYAASSSTKSPASDNASSSPVHLQSGHEEGQQLADGKEDAPKSPAAGVSTSGITQSTETVLQAIDKTMDFTSDLLGNAVFKGYQTIEASGVPDRLGELSTSDVVNQGKQVGETLMNHGLTALEAIGSIVGRNVAQSLAEQRQRTMEQQDQPSGVAKKESTVADYFEDNCGNAHLQALEMLGAEAQIKVDTYIEEAGGEEEIESTIPETLEFIKAQLDRDSLHEAVNEETGSRLTTDDGFKALKDTLLSIKVANTSQLEQLKEFIIQTAEKLSSAPNSDALRSDTMIAQADLAEKACEQILRIAEIMLMLIAEDVLEKKEATKAELPQRCSKFTSAMKDFATSMELEARVLSETAARAEQKLELESPGVTELKQFATEATAFVHSAVESTIPIIQLMLVSL